MTRQITEAQRLELIGLGKLAEEHNRQLKYLSEAALSIIGSPEENEDHVSDWIYGGWDVTLDELLRRCGVELAPVSTPDLKDALRTAVANLECVGINMDGYEGKDGPEYIAAFNAWEADLKKCKDALAEADGRIS